MATNINKKLSILNAPVVIFILGVLVSGIPQLVIYIKNKQLDEKKRLENISKLDLSIQTRLEALGDIMIIADKNERGDVNTNKELQQIAQFTQIGSQYDLLNDLSDLAALEQGNRKDLIIKARTSLVALVSRITHRSGLIYRNKDGEIQGNVLSGMGGKETPGKSEPVGYSTDTNGNVKTGYAFELEPILSWRMRNRKIALRQLPLLNLKRWNLPMESCIYYLENASAENQTP